MAEIDGKTRRRMNEREWQCFEEGVNYERERIVKDLKRITIVDSMSRPMPKAIQDIITLIGGTDAVV
jgi:hypothetical protein